MDSVRGTRTVRLQRKKSGLGFSVKGGKEHGVPIVVSWIKPNGVAAKQQLRLGDVILAVNGRSLQGASHGEAVQRLKKARPTVLLRVRPNHVLADVFSTNEIDRSNEKEEEEEEREGVDSTADGQSCGHGNEKPLPTGWARKVDAKTGRPYYENHYTETTSWSDPRSLTPIPLNQFDWLALPSSWERQLTDAGDIYYVCHDTQTTQWESPRGQRQLKQLKEMVIFLHLHKQLLKERETELAKKRECLLEMNTTLLQTSQPPVPTLQLEPTNTNEVEEEDKEVELESSDNDIINDMMSLNEEVEVMNQEVCQVRDQLKELGEVVSHAQYEDIGEEDEFEAAAKLSEELSSDYRHFKSLETKLQEIVSLLEELRRDQGVSDTPLSYMMQLPPKRRETAAEEKGAWLHTLPDRLTGKTNCEMRVEKQLLRDMIGYSEDLNQRHVLKSRDSGWSQVMEELAGMDLSPLQDQWLLEGSTQQEKLDRLVPQTEQWSVLYTRTDNND